MIVIRLIFLLLLPGMVYATPAIEVVYKELDRPWTTSNAFNGRFEDFRVYSRALSASEVSALAAD